MPAYPAPRQARGSDTDPSADDTGLVRDRQRRRDDGTLVAQIVRRVAARIDEHLLRPGMRLPSIRHYAAEQQVSRFTVVEAYDRLIARGYIEARPGSGFYVRSRDLTGRPRPSDPPRVGNRDERGGAEIDVVWLIRNMLRQLPAADMPGGGLLPPDWLDADLLGGSLRALARQNSGGLTGYGHPQGYLPLRNALQAKLARIDIEAAPEQLLTTNGVTQGLDLVTRHFVKPGDTVLVEDPGWFLMFGRLALTGARVLGVPRRADGPDLAALADLAGRFSPKLFVMSSVLHNPTGTSLSPARAYGLLQLAERHDFRIVEDDIYGDVHPGSGLQSIARLAALDQLQRVIYLGSFSKVLSASIRVGFIACDPALARQLTDLKMLCGLTTPELGERLACRVLTEGHYRRHLERLRGRLAEARDRTLPLLERIGLRRFDAVSHGMFHWMDTGVDSVALAQAMHERGYLMAPGSLFSPNQAPSTWMRFNIATIDAPKMLAALAESLAKLSAGQSRHNPGS